LIAILIVAIRNVFFVQLRIAPCHGTGAEPGTRAKNVLLANGHRRIMLRRLFQCRPPKCRGTGEYLQSLAETCHGTGKHKKQKTLKIEIPAGIDDGMHITLLAMVSLESMKSSGDLYVEVRIKSNH
jgi:molecular chaperone DnaJ